MPSSPPQLGTTGRILEGIVTTQNEDGTWNVAPMGPIVGDPLETIVLRPFRSSTTFGNLQRTGRGVLHTCDDVFLLAQAAIESVESPQLLREFDPPVLEAACSWFAFEVTDSQQDSQRATFSARVTDRGVLREFLGYNRAQNAVLEAAILSTRVHLLPAEQITAQLEQLRILVHKTGSGREHQAFELLQDFVRTQTLADVPRGGDRS